MQSQSVTSDGTVKNYVNGSWRTVGGDAGQAVVNPGTGERLGYVGFSDEETVDEAVTAAQAAFEEWSSAPVEERVQPLFRLKTLLEENQEDIARTLVQDHGKTMAEARGEIRRGIENVEVACGVATTMQGGTLANAAPNIDEQAIRQPLGVFAAVTAFNFPAMIPLWFLPYAVATGNAFILKPSEQDPLTAGALFELVEDAGFPDGIIQLVHGSKDTVTSILEHDGIAGVSFVGSTPVAEHIYETAAANGKRVQAQGGAKNHIIVAESADIEYAAQKTVSSACACAGERCLANDLALVEESIYEEFLDAVLTAADEQTVGYGLDDETDIGALITPEHGQSVANYIQLGVEEGARLLRDGRDVTVDGYEDGTYMGPTILGDVTPDMVVAQEEIFGPVLGIASVPDVESAIEWLNGSDFGNAASLFTERGADARRFKAEADPGNLGVNVGTVAPMAFFHFGGRKDSFFGDLHAQGEDAIRFYTDETIYIERWPNA